jgi:hypothetical protein
MCKNVILNTAINAVLDLPRKAFWATTAVTVAFSLEAGLAIVGDTLDLKSAGTAQVHAAPGLLENQNVATAVGPKIGAYSMNVFVSAGSAGINSALAVSVLASVMTVAGTSTTNAGAVVYASEIFRGTVPDSLPGGTAANGGTTTSGSSNFQAICYQVPGTINKNFSIAFNMTGGSFQSGIPTTPPDGPIAFGIRTGTGAAPAGDNCNFKGSVSGATATLEVGEFASCSIGDGAQLCLVYKILGSTATALKDPGKTISIDAKITAGGLVVAQAAPIVVAESKQGATFSLIPESDGETYISVSSGNKEFITADPAGLITADDGNTFLTASEVKIGYITFASGGAVGMDGSGTFSLGTDTTDTATLKITNGQFSASPGGSSSGRAYLNGVSNAIATVDLITSTATWSLTNTQLANIIANTPISIIVRVDGISEIKDTEGGTDPVGELTVSMAGAPISDTPPTSALRRIPYDGKVCTAYNIPSPTGAADILTLRITNDSDQAGTILGTLYNEAGEAVGEALDLLAGHIDYTKTPPVDRTTLGLGDPLQLQPRETVILTSQNIATVFGQTEWPGERWVLKILSTIPRIEVFNLLRNVENVGLQPLSNISTSADGVECSPIP